MLLVRSKQVPNNLDWDEVHDCGTFKECIAYGDPDIPDWGDHCFGWRTAFEDQDSVLFVSDGTYTIILAGCIGCENPYVVVPEDLKIVLGLVKEFYRMKKEVIDVLENA